MQIIGMIDREKVKALPLLSLAMPSIKHAVIYMDSFRLPGLQSTGYLQIANFLQTKALNCLKTSRQ